MSIGPLNLQDADIKGFDALDPGKYNAEVFAITMDAVKNTDGTGKMPSGTPMIKVQVKILDPRIDDQLLDQDRRAFTSFSIPPKGYDAKKAKIINGMIARFFIALGEPEEKVLSNKFDPNFDDYIGRACVVSLSKEEYPKGSGEYQNRIKGFKPAGSAGASDSVGGLL